MQIFGYEIAVKKALPLAPISSRGSWWPVIREAFTGAWQRNVEWTYEDVLAHPIVYACIRLIGSDIGKMTLNLVKEVGDDIWVNTENPAYSPVLRRPNHFSTPNQFFEQWMYSKLIRGNTYVLLGRDQRRVVTAMYVLDPSRVKPLVAPNGDVYYELQTDHLSQIAEDTVTVPASEIIHDRMTALYHPLCGLSPLMAAGMAANQGLRIQTHSATFFERGSVPSGVLTAPGVVSESTAKRLQTFWESQFTGENAGRTAVLGDGLKYEPMTMKAIDAQLVEQWDKTSYAICSAFGVPAFKVGVGPAPAYNDVETVNLLYYSDTIQAPATHIEQLLDRGLGLQKPYGTSFDIDDLIRMNTSSRVESASKAVRAGMSYNEARHRFYDLGPTEGGDTPFAQLQDWPVHILAQRGAADLVKEPSVQASLPAATTPDDDELSDDEAEKVMTVEWRKSFGLVAA